MRRAVALFGAFLLYVAMARAGEMPPNHSDVGIVMFTTDNGAQPTEGVYYSLNQTVPFQKVDGGYLIVGMFNDGTVEPRPVYLRTKKEYSEGQFLNGWAKCLGRIQFNGLNGFPQTFFAFELSGERP